MATKRRPRKARKTARIYYGMSADGPLYWVVKVTDAKETVHIKSTIADALLGKPGTTIGCHLSQCAKRNAAAFPHAVKLASFTKASCLIIDQIKNGRPIHAWRYFHLLGPLVDLNDKDKLKRRIKANPALVERTIALYHPYQYETSDRKITSKGTKYPKGDYSKVSKVPKGAMARAINANLINAVLDS